MDLSVAQDGLVDGLRWVLNRVVYSFFFGLTKAGNRGVLEFGPQMLELRCWILAAQLDSQPSPTLATHLYDG